MSSIATEVARLVPEALTAAGLTEDDILVNALALTTFEGFSQLEHRDVLWIGSMHSYHRRKGVGRLAMAQICMLADQHDCVVALNPWAQSHDGGLNQLELERFYQSLGFGWHPNHVMVREAHVPTVVNTWHDVGYLPSPNRIDLVFDTTPPPITLTRSAFMVALMPDGSVVMAVNRRRGMEVPGGHIDNGERQDEAALREGFEEAGVRISRHVTLGHLRMTSDGEVPAGWRYPHPLSYQSFFAGLVTDMVPYVENDECRSPKVVSDISLLKPHVRLMVQRARVLLDL